MIFNCEMKSWERGVAVEWCEARAGLEWCASKIASSGLYYGIMGGVMGLALLAMGWSPVWLVLAGVIFGASYAVMWLGVRTPAKQRAIYFARGGEIFSPYGLFDGSRVEGAWKTKLGDIANFEAEQMGQSKPDDDAAYTHGVRMVLRSGRVHHVAGNLTPDDASMLAYNLSLAREMMRYEPSAPTPRARAHAVVY